MGEYAEMQMEEDDRRFAREALKKRLKEMRASRQGCNALIATRNPRWPD